MRPLGIVLVIVGAFWGIASLNMDTTVETSGGSFGSYSLPSRVHNLGLMNQQKTHTILSGVIFVAGIVLIGFGTLAESQTKVEAPPTGPRCPKCNGLLEGRPQLCMHCRSELRWMHGEPLTPEVAMERAKQHARQTQEWEEVVRREEDERANQDSERRKAALARKERWSERIAATGNAIIGIGTGFDGMLQRMAGEDQIFYRMLQGMVYLVLPAVAVAAFVLLRS